MIGRNGWAGLVVLAFCAALYWLTLGIKGNPLVPVSPAFYPRIVLGVSAVLAVLLVVTDVLGRRSRAAQARPQPAAKLNYALVTLTFAVFGVYVVALPYVGFRLATVAYVAATAALLGRPRNAQGWVKVLVLAVATAAVTYFVFERYLSVLLPRGKWSGF
jgi:hypothetical protein